MQHVWSNFPRIPPRFYQFLYFFLPIINDCLRDSRLAKRTTWSVERNDNFFVALKVHNDEDFK